MGSMALGAPFNPGDPGDERAASTALGGARAELELRLVRDGVQVLARGSLVCPECELPLPGRPAVAATRALHCAWCGHSGRAVEMLREGPGGAPASRVALVARVAAT
jgi:hypothetical protein